MGGPPAERQGEKETREWGRESSELEVLLGGHPSWVPWGP